MTSGVPKILGICKRCNNAPAVKDYCRTCSPIMRNQKKREWRINNDPLGMLILDGVKRAPSLTIVSDPLEFGGFFPGMVISGKVEITSMLSCNSFTDNTIVEAGGRMLKIVGGKFCPIDIE